MTTLSKSQKQGLHAAIVAHLTAKGEPWAGVAMAMKEAAAEQGRANDNAFVVVSGNVLIKAWLMCNQQASTKLDSAVQGYLTAEAVQDARFARTVAAAYNEVLRTGTGGGGGGGGGGGSGSGSGSGSSILGSNAPTASGDVLKKLWKKLHKCLTTKKYRSLLYDGIESGDTEMVELFVCVGIDVQALRHGYDEWPPLQCAAFYNRLDVVKCLYASGHVQAKNDYDGGSPLYVAAQEGHAAIVQYLVEQGADVDEENVSLDRQTPVYAAAENGMVAVVRYLVEQGADKDKANSLGKTPLLAAVEELKVDVATYLVNHDADMNRAQDHVGFTPLMAACKRGCVAIVECLLKKGCDIECTDCRGFTALHYTADCTDPYSYSDLVEVAQLLFQYGAQLNTRSTNGRTAADIALTHGFRAFKAAVDAEEIRRRDHGFKRDRSTIEGTEEHEAAKRPRVEAVEEVAAEEADESDDDDDDDDDEIEFVISL
jgi:ankyrin repeat protein